MSAQLVVGPHSSSSLIRTNSVFTVEEITVNNLNITSSLTLTGGLTANGVTSTGDVNISGVYNIDGNEVLSENTLGIGIVNSSLETVGTLQSLTISGDLTVDTNTFFVDSINNNVGINNSAPSSLFVLDISGDTNIDGSITISGDLNVLGGITSTFSVTATVEENFVKLATSNTTDMIDTGVFNLYNDGTTKFAGYFRDATDGVFKFFQGTTEEPSTTIDLSSGGISIADILVNNIDATTMNIGTTGLVQDLGITNNLFVSNNVDISNDLIVDTDTLFVDSSLDRVGINNSAPSYELDVSGDVNTTGVYRVDGTEVLTEDTLGTSITTSSLETVGTLQSLDVSGNLTVDTDVLVVNTITNRVGINNSAPSFELDVSGDINTSGNDYRVNGISVLNDSTLGSGVTSSSLTNVGNLTDLTIVGDLTVDSNTLIVDSTNNTVGIGITTTSQRFHVSENSVSSTVQALFENINPLGSAGIQLNNASSNFNLIQDNDDTTLTNFGGNIEYLAKDTGRHRFFTTDSDVARLTIENDGTVGVGKTTPSFNLDVSGDINTDGVYRIDGTEIISDTGITSLGNINFNSTSRIEEQGGNIYISTTDIRQFQFNTNGDFINVNGNIGINVGNPGIDLAIGTTGTGLNQESSNELAIYTNGSEAVRIDVNGLMGINNTNPLHELDVNGTINFTGQILQNGAQLVGTDGVWTQQGTGGYVTLGGSIGIGTTFPQAQLHVEGNGIISDNLGIGTTFPQAQLHVEGNGIISGNLGIGITTAGNPIHIVTSATTGNAMQIRNDTNNSTANASILLRTNSASGGDACVDFDVFQVGGWRIGLDNSDSDKFKISNGAPAAFGTNDFFVIDTSGNIGIGTTTPETRLHINQADGIDNKQLLISAGTVTGNDSGIEIRGASSNTGAVDQATLLFTNFDSDLSASKPLGQISGHVTNSGMNSGDMVFYSFNTGVTKIEVMRIVEEGDVGIGTGNPQAKLHVGGDVIISDTLGIGTALPVAELHVEGDTIISGMLGIGITVASTSIHIFENTNPKIFLENSTHRHFLSSVAGGLDFGNDQGSNGFVRFIPDGSEKVRITSNALIINGTSTDSLPILELMSGNDATVTNNGAQIAFGFNDADDFQHFIQTRHNSGSSVNNAIDFFTCDGTQNNSVTSGSLHSFTIEDQKIGIGVTNPEGNIHIFDDSATFYFGDNDARSTITFRGNTTGSGTFVDRYLINSLSGGNANAHTWFNDAGTSVMTLGNGGDFATAGDILATGSNLGKQLACQINLTGKDNAGFSVASGVVTTINLNHTETPIIKTANSTYNRTYNYNKGYDDTIFVDSSGGAVLTERVIITRAGLYDIRYRVSYATNSTGVRTGFIEINGAGLNAENTSPAVSAVPTALSGAIRLNLAVSDFITVLTFQNSGIALTVTGELEVLLVSTTV